MRRVALSGHVVDTGAKLQLKIESAKGNAEKNNNETLHGPFVEIACGAAGRKKALLERNEQELETIHLNNEKE